MAVLAAITISSEKECVGDLAAETAGNVDKLDESYNGRFRECQSFATNQVDTVRLDDLCLALDHQAKGTTHRDHSQRLERGVQCQAPHGHSPEIAIRWMIPTCHAGLGYIRGENHAAAPN